MNIGYEERRNLNPAAKRAIAQACAAEIPNNISIFLNIGTSTEAVAEELMHHENLTVVTNNMNVAQILSANPDCEIVLAGGALRRSDSGLVGHLTARTIEDFKFDHAILGCSALDEDGDMLDFDIQEVLVGQTLLRRSREVMLVADASKFKRNAPARIGSLRDVDHVFTDAPLPAPLAARCATWATHVHLCPPQD